MSSALGAIMTSPRHLFIAACALTTGLFGCAQTPANNASSPGASAVSQSPPPAAATASPASAAPAVAADHAAASTGQSLLPPPTKLSIVDPETLRQAEQLGFTPVTRNGTTVYCRDVTELGSRFTKRQCISEQGVMTLVHQQTQSQDQFRNNPAPVSSH